MYYNNINRYKLKLSWKAFLLVIITEGYKKTTWLYDNNISGRIFIIFNIKNYKNCKKD